ncbi:MAG TPA: 23S rRNA (pseudouridine(1915)-N(3))-methyltransferase RlmH [Blastocatellia bacterium]|nr:23S rRNA (pseudouridine(1915)-N(3))-methyltransferase RlmH [Blastocatellia bacterium]
MRLHFVWIGKTRERHCAALVNDYLGRLEHFAGCEVSEIREQSGAGDERRMMAAEGAKLLSSVERDDYVILLDEAGKQLSSAELAEFIGARQQDGVRRMALIIGGFAGVSDEVRRRASFRLSLSRMTLTHELARVILTEQIYRAFTLLAGLPYHRS